VVEELGGLDVPLGAIDGAGLAGQAWELVARVQPEILVCDAASAAHLFAAIQTPVPAWWRGIVWLANGALGPLPAPPAGFAGWQRTWLAVPEATSFVAGSCATGALHVDADVLAEVVDEASGAASRAGEPGVLALTPLGGETRLLRYATEIRVRLLPDPCACGRPGPALEAA
jgi:hypothetical protein